jgi:predicted DsbA family dithiol-disulfide isomerase
MAMESPRVTADVIEVQEYPDLASAYRVMGVPKTVINDRVQFTGAVPEDALMKYVLQAVGADEAGEEESEHFSDQTTPIA